MRSRQSREQRYSLGEIEALAARQLTEFRARLTRNGYELPAMPPVPVEYMALTLTEFTVRAVPNLLVGDRKLAGLLDPNTEEILYEANDIPGRQNFSIAHEIGHYFLHYLPQKERAEMPSLFSREELDAVSVSKTTKFFRCAESEIDVEDEIESEPTTEETTETPANVEPEPETRKPESIRDALNNPEKHAKLAKVLRFKEYRSRHEWEANVFASALLMPPDLVRWLRTKHGNDIRRIASELNVSQQALSYRLERLREITPSNPNNKKSSNSSNEQGTFF